MNKCQFQVQSIKRMAHADDGGGILPPEYQQVEYLQSTGEQVIDTGVAPSTRGVRTSLRFELVTGFTYSNASFLFGSYQSQGYSIALASATTLRVGVDPSTGEWFTNYTSPSLSVGVHEITYQYGTIIVDSQQISTTSGVNSLSIGLFGRNDSGTVGAYKTPYLRIYHAQISTQYGAVQSRDLYPCYRKADNVTGMYDLINSEFIPYSGTANFIVGQDV